MLGCEMPMTRLGHLAKNLHYSLCSQWDKIYTSTACFARSGIKYFHCNANYRNDISDDNDTTVEIDQSDEPTSPAYLT